jgi:hypothetical protein
MKISRHPGMLFHPLATVYIPFTPDFDTLIKILLQQEKRCLSFVCFSKNPYHA